MSQQVFAVPGTAISVGRSKIGRFERVIGNRSVGPRWHVHRIRITVSTAVSVRTRASGITDKGIRIIALVRIAREQALKQINRRKARMRSV